MALVALGKVSVASAGTPERITKGQSDPTARLGFQTLFVQPLAGNSGTNIYIGNSTMSKSTLAGVYAIVPKTLAQGIQLSIPLAPSGMNAAEIYIDADTTNDSAVITLLQQ